MPQAIASIVGSIVGANAAEDAASSQQAAADNATAEQRRQFDIAQKNQAPFLQTGTAANQRLAYLLGLSSPTPATAPAPAAPGPSPTGASSYSDAQNSYLRMLDQSAALPSNTTFQKVDPNSFYGNNFVTIPRYGIGGATPLTTQAQSLGFNLGDVYSFDVNGNPTTTAQTPTATNPATSTPATDPNTDPAFGSLTKPFSMADFQADPGYQFRMDQGLQALQRSAASKGLLSSGATLKGITNFAQGTAAQEYGAAYDRYNNNQTNLYNRLAGISGTGQTAANNLGVLGANTANQISSNILGAGNAQAAGTIGSANAFSTGLSNIAKGFTTSNLNSIGNIGSGYNSSAASYYNPGTFDSAAAANGLPWSDLSLKENITYRGTENGYPVYEFAYKWDSRRYIGVIAQQIQDLKPEAVHERDGYLCVDYSVLGIDFREANHAP